MNKFYKTLTLTLLFVSSQLLAHAGLKTSEPKNGAVLMQSPEKLQLEFTKAVRLVKVTITSKAGKNIPLEFDGRGKPSIAYSIQLPKLINSDYQVSWMAMGSDTHKMKGSFRFIVKGNETKALLNKIDKHSNNSTVNHSH